MVKLVWLTYFYTFGFYSEFYYIKKFPFLLGIRLKLNFLSNGVGFKNIRFMDQKLAKTLFDPISCKVYWSLDLTFLTKSAD